MDDAARKLTLQNAGYDIGGIIQGYNREGAVPPPACEDAGFGFYSDIGYVYAFDNENETIYFEGANGIERMGLDGKQELLDGAGPS